MQTSNPFELILDRLEQLQTTVHNLSVQQQDIRTASPEPDSDRLLNLPEAATLMRKPIGTVRQYIHSRNLPATKIGKSYLIKYGELLKWIESFQDRQRSIDPMEGVLANRKRYRKS